jgi:hypothetical protein
MDASPLRTHPGGPRSSDPFDPLMSSTSTPLEGRAASTPLRGRPRSMADRRFDQPVGKPHPWIPPPAPIAVPAENMAGRPSDSSARLAALLAGTTTVTSPQPGGKKRIEQQLSEPKLYARAKKVIAAPPSVQQPKFEVQRTQPRFGIEVPPFAKESFLLQPYWKSVSSSFRATCTAGCLSFHPMAQCDHKEHNIFSMGPNLGTPPVFV